jgi:hypothetical protein
MQPRSARSSCGNVRISCIPAICSERASESTVSSAVRGKVLEGGTYLQSVTHGAEQAQEKEGKAYVSRTIHSRCSSPLGAPTHQLISHLASDMCGVGEADRVTTSLSLLKRPSSAPDHRIRIPRCPAGSLDHALLRNRKGETWWETRATELPRIRRGF